MGTIVVGVDGSVGARTALEFAAREAALRKARLRIVCAWDMSPAVYVGGFAPGLDQGTIDGFREGAEAVAREAVEAARLLQLGLRMRVRQRRGNRLRRCLKRRETPT